MRTGSNRPSLAAGLEEAGIKPSPAVPIISVAVLTWFAAPIPEGLTPPAWHLFLIFISTIAIVIANAMPLFVAAIGALLFYEHWIVRPTDLSRINKAFFDINGYVSVAFLGFVGIDQYL